MGFQNFGMGEILVILVIVLLLFGAKVNLIFLYC